MRAKFGVLEDANDVRLCAKFRLEVCVRNFVLTGLFCRPLAAKNPNFVDFWTAAFCGVASWLQSEKVEHRCTTTNLLLSKVSKSFLYSNAFWRNRAHNL